ncbi:hypothetical protein JXA63_01210 [Candidatus Woesebacteria bacterium]|nr:hypothetical protein [Candidatus Woesebacteria bacterium]
MENKNERPQPIGKVEYFTWDPTKMEGKVNFDKAIREFLYGDCEHEGNPPGSDAPAIPMEGGRRQR